MAKKTFIVPVELIFKGKLEITASNQKEAMQIARKRANGRLTPSVDEQFNDVINYEFSIVNDDVKTDKINTKQK